MKLRSVALALTTLLALAPSLRAQTWTGASDYDFFNAANWSPATTPNPGDALIFTSGAFAFVVNFNAPYAVGNLNFNNAGYSLGGSGSPTLTLNGNISVITQNVDFTSGIGAITLSGGAHTFQVGPNSNYLNFHQGIAGTGSSLYKDGYGNLVFYGANTYTDGTTINAGTISVDGATAAITHLAANLTVSGLSAGLPTLTISNGGNVSNFQSHLGIGTGLLGQVTVSDAGSTWTTVDYLYVGEAGSGTLAINTGGTVTAGDISIGNNPGGNGAVTVDGTGSSLNQTDNTIGNGLFVGSQGTGTLTIQNGAAVTSVDGSIGNNSGGNGMVNVTGIGSSWSNSGNMYVGATTTGGLNITAGGSVSTYNVTVGNSSGGIGGLTVDGSGTALAVTADLRVGWQGDGTMQISNGGHVTSVTGVLGEQSGAMGTTKIYGSGSLLNVSGTDLYVGNGGTGKLYVYNGGQVSIGGGNGTLDLGHSATGLGDLYLGFTGSSYAAGGVVNAATITTGGSGGTGALHLGTDATVTSAYYLTKTGLTGGPNITISGPTALTNNAGYNIIRGNNTYTGPTDIYGGTLVAGEPFTATTPLGSTGTVTVHSGGTLAAYNAFINNPVILQSGSRLIGDTSSGGGIANAVIGSGMTLSPGFDFTDPVNGPLGTLRFDTLTLGGGATLEIKLADSTGLTNNSVTVTNPALTITATSGSPLTLKLISMGFGLAPGALTGGVAYNTTASLGFLAFSSQAGNPLILGDNLVLDTSAFDTGLGVANNFTLTETGNVYYLNFTPVPEPSTYALMALGLAGTGLAAWRKRRNCRQGR